MIFVAVVVVVVVAAAAKVAAVAGGSYLACDQRVPCAATIARI